MAYRLFLLSLGEMESLQEDFALFVRFHESIPEIKEVKKGNRPNTLDFLSGSDKKREMKRLRNKRARQRKNMPEGGAEEAVEEIEEEAAPMTLDMDDLDLGMCLYYTSLYSSPHHIHYVEFPSSDFDATRAFFTDVFGWVFTPCDGQTERIKFTGPGLKGGFFLSDIQCTRETGGSLVVIKVDDLEGTLAKVETSGGTIIKPIFGDVGDRSFHFSDPTGNEWAVAGK
ncbi:hypothetical protein KIPB_002138 [Kipferlia bialata]|uniref:VOC domain-containing protein n=1 Tax=Kipferlia bialata TaxID=797122 RepID=A0A9K3CRT3_9EUKA|nr:hypothetical protein KIPB_002138 [Kipferlia bialata]|eukprot:g2138.t1